MRASDTPTEEPTLQPVVIDEPANPDTRAGRAAAAATPAPVRTPTPQPTPTTAPVQAQEVVNGVMAESFQPVMVGGGIGLAGAGATSLGALVLSLLRRRR